MTKLEAWKAWCESAGTPDFATEFTLEQSSHGKAFSFAWEHGVVEREKVAAWMMRLGYATGHGDSVEDLLQELDWQIREQERESRGEK